MHYGHSLILKFNLNRIRIVKLESSLYVYFNQYRCRLINYWIRRYALQQIKTIENDLKVIGRSL